MEVGRRMEEDEKKMVNDCGGVRLRKGRGSYKIKNNRNILPNYLHNSNNFRIFVVGNEKYNTGIMEQTGFQHYSDAEFRAALIATMNLKQEWMASVEKREKELGLR